MPPAMQAPPAEVQVPLPRQRPDGSGAELVQPLLAADIHQSVIIENKSGASGVVGTEAISRSPADGSTIGMVISSHASNTALYPKLPYDAVRDLAPVTVIATQALVVVVTASLPVKMPPAGITGMSSCSAFR